MSHDMQWLQARPYSLTPRRNPNKNWAAIRADLLTLKQRYGHAWLPLQHNEPIRLKPWYVGQKLGLATDQFQMYWRLCGPHVNGHPTKIPSRQLATKRGGRKTVGQKIEKPMGWEVWIRLTPDADLTDAQKARIAARDAREAALEKVAPRRAPAAPTPEEVAKRDREAEIRAMPLSRQKKIREQEALDARKEAWKKKWEEVDKAEADAVESEKQKEEARMRAYYLHMERKKRAPMVQKYKYN